MRKFNLLAKLLFPAFLIFPYVAQAEMPINQSDLISKNGTWQYKPNFYKVRLPADCKPHEKFKILTQFDVDKNGNILQPRIIKSSGNEQTDNDVIKILKTGKYYPFLNDGMPLSGKGKLSIVINCMPNSQDVGE